MGIETIPVISLKNKLFGNSCVILENEKIKITFTNKGAEIKSAIIKGFYTYIGNIIDNI